MSKEAKENLELILKTLNKLEVHGKDNLDMLLGCMLTLEKVIKEDDHAVLDSNRNSEA